MLGLRMTQYGSISGAVWVQFTQTASRGRCTHYNGAFPDCGFGGKLWATLQPSAMERSWNCVCVYVCAQLCECVCVCMRTPAHVCICHGAELQPSPAQWELEAAAWHSQTMATQDNANKMPGIISPSPCATACKAFASSAHPFPAPT